MEVGDYGPSSPGGGETFGGGLSKGMITTLEGKGLTV